MQSLNKKGMKSWSNRLHTLDTQKVLRTCGRINGRTDGRTDGVPPPLDLLSLLRRE